MKQLLLVFIGGGTGSALRFLLGKFLNNPNTGIPYGTFSANIVGSLIIGIILGLAAETNAITEDYKLLLAVGFCGGFTTFSSFAYENHLFLKEGDLLHFALYTIASFSVGIFAVFGGIWLAKSF